MPFGRIFLIVALIVSLVPRALSIFHDLCNFYSVTQSLCGGDREAIHAIIKSMNILKHKAEENTNKNCGRSRTLRRLQAKGLETGKLCYNACRSVVGVPAVNPISQ